MKKPFVWLLGAATHVAAFGVGWWWWQDAGESRNGTRDGLARSERRERELRPRGRMSGEEILREITADLQLQTRRPGSDAGAEFRQRHLRLLEKANRTNATGDREAAAISQIEDYLSANTNHLEDPEKIIISLVHWMQEDPEAAVAKVVSYRDATRQGILNHLLRQAAVAVALESGVETAAGWLKLDPAFSIPFGSDLVRILSSDGDLDGLAKIKAELDPSRWAGLQGELTDSWPLDQSSKVIELARSERQPGMLAKFALANGADGARWLMRLLEGGAIDEATREALVSHHEFANLMMRSPTIDLTTRVGFLAAFSDEEPLEVIEREICQADVRRALGESRDYRYAFRTGQMTAEEIIAAVSGELPGLSATAPQIIQDEIFRELAEENGGKALRMLDPLSPEQKWETAMKPVREMFHQSNPQEFYDYLQNIPPDATATAWDERLDAWSKLGQENHARLGMDYVMWVQGLPEGLDRDMASYALVRSLGDKHPQIVRELSSGIRDGQVRSKLSPPP